LARTFPSRERPGFAFELGLDLEVLEPMLSFANTSSSVGFEKALSFAKSLAPQVVLEPVGKKGPNFAKSLAPQVVLEPVEKKALSFAKSLAPQVVLEPVEEPTMGLAKSLAPQVVLDQQVG